MAKPKKPVKKSKRIISKSTNKKKRAYTKRKPVVSQIGVVPKSQIPIAHNNTMQIEHKDSNEEAKKKIIEEQRKEKIAQNEINEARRQRDEAINNANNEARIQAIERRAKEANHSNSHEFNNDSNQLRIENGLASIYNMMHSSNGDVIPSHLPLNSGGMTVEEVEDNNINSHKNNDENYGISFEEPSVMNDIFSPKKYKNGKTVEEVRKQANETRRANKAQANIDKMLEEEERAQKNKLTEERRIAKSLKKNQKFLDTPEKNKNINQKAMSAGIDTDSDYDYGINSKFHDDAGIQNMNRILELQKIVQAENEGILNNAKLVDQTSDFTNGLIDQQEENVNHSIYDNGGKFFGENPLLRKKGTSQIVKSPSVLKSSDSWIKK